MTALLVFCVIVAVLAGVVAMIDVVVQSDEVYEAVRTNEVVLLYLVNVLIAAVITYLLATTTNIQVGLLSGVGVVLAYPVLLHTKLFSVQSPTANQPIDVGFEWVYKRVSDWLVPNIRNSIEERASEYVREFRAMDMADLVTETKDYLSTKAVLAEQLGELSAWLDRLQQDAANNPNREDSNKRAIFEKVRDVGSYRGVRHIIKRVPQR